MPRPQKYRKVCCLPENGGFVPVNQREDLEAVILSIDEYEALRLIDREGFSQEQCGEYMHIARATVQQIYAAARRKLADALVEGRPIRIEGGHYRLCDGREEYCACGGCRRHRRDWTQRTVREDGRMKTAIPLDENKRDVCIVLARAPYFLFRENGEDTVVENPAAQAQSGAGLQAAQFLVDQGVDVLITVRCGQNAADVFKAAHMKIYKSENKVAADDLNAWEKGMLGELTQFHGGFHGGL